MGMEAINGFSPLIQQAQPQVRTQVQEQSQSQSEIVNMEAKAAQNMELKVEAADNSAGSNNDAQSGAQAYTQAQNHIAETEEQIKADNEKVKKAISQMTNVEIAADIISLIRRYAIGSALISHEIRIHNAVDKLKQAHDFSTAELAWIGRMEKYLMEKLI